MMYYFGQERKIEHAVLLVTLMTSITPSGAIFV
jgi:hypothetical protein